MAHPPPENLSPDELIEELTFIDVLLSSLDPEAGDYDERLAELEALRTKYSDRADALEAAAPQSQSQASGQMDTTMNMDGMSGPSSDSWWQDGYSSRPDSNHSSIGDILGNPFSGTSHYGMPASNGVKRQRPEASHLDAYEHPSKRHTPEPTGNGPTASYGASYDLVDRNSSDRMRRQQFAAEAAARRQHDAQKADAAFARELSQADHMLSNGSRSSSGPSFQTTLNSNGTYQRPRPVTKPEASSSARPMSYSQPFASPQQHAYAVKAEPGIAREQQLPQRPRQPTQVVDLTGDDSDEDISAIAPNSFTPRPRQQAPQNFHQNINGNGFGSAKHLHTPASTTMRMPTTMQQMPGTYPSSQSPNGLYGQHGHQFTNGQSVYTQSAGMANVGPSNGNPWLAQTMNGIRNTAGRLAGPVRELGGLVYGSSSHAPLELDSEDDDEIAFTGSRQRSGFGNYAGQEDLYRDRYEALAAYDSTKTKEELQALLQNIRPDEDLPAHLRVQTPEEMSVKLHKYQELGLTWLKKCEEGTNKGGILADDMGLGKTIQMLSLMVSRKSADQRCKTTLIIAPVALMRQWAQEISNKIKPGYKLAVYTHHGSKKAKNFEQLRHFDVVLTTYGTISSELKRRERFELRKQADRDARPYDNEKTIFLSDEARWYRVILDEAQCIKNRNTQASKGACRLKAQYRFCVTGTPMMNNVEEFYSLIQFLGIKPYCNWQRFRLDIHTPIRSAQDETRAKAMQMLQALCKAVMLRRTKQSKFEGQPILVLPERSTTVDFPIFSEDESNFYKALENKTQLDFNKYLRRGQIGTSYSAILVLLLRLRQACCHPHLIKDFGVAAAADLHEDQLVEFAKELTDPVVARIKESGGDFECPVCYDATPNPAIFIPCGHDTCSECLARIADPANAIQNGEENPGVRCPNCRGQIDPKRLTDFESFKKVHMPELLADQEREQQQTNDDGEEDSDDDDDDDDNDSDGSSTEDEAEEETEDETLGGFIVGDDEEDDDKDKDQAHDDVKLEEGVAGPSNPAGAREGKGKKSKGKGKAKKEKGKGKGKKKEKKPKSTVTLAELKKLASRSKAAKKMYLRRLRKHYISSAKLDKTMEILGGIMADREGEKVLVFSQWTSLLDLLEIPIDQAGYGYRRYDGSMTAQMRGDAVDDFRDESKNVWIMLVSLKAGNAGLNLNMASQVIILDPFWNPYIEEQAIDRAHRFGQMRPVKVHRVLIQETVEDRIIALQEKKRALISEALDEKSAHALSRLGIQELAYLFGLTHSPEDNVHQRLR